MFKFSKSVGQETKEVTWPTAKQNRRDTTTVIVTSVLFVLFLGAPDWAFSTLTRTTFQQSQRQLCGTIILLVREPLL